MKHYLKQNLKRFLALMLCVFIILPSVSNLLPYIIQLFPTVYASDYKKGESDEDNGYDYYIVEGKDVEKLFDFGISDIEADKLISWVLTFKTYTVIKDDGSNYTIFFNTPNLQSIVKNQVIGGIDDGYTDGTYDVNETQWIVPVGKSTNKVNAITKYGFNIANNTYMGEYPKAVMSVAGIVPDGFWSGLWRGFLSLFGASFLNAPNADNFNTITYLNHGYKDDQYWLIEFFEKYYITYLVNNIAVNSYDGDTYFTSPENLIEETITDDEKTNAENYQSKHEDEYKSICAKLELYNTFTSAGIADVSTGDFAGLSGKQNGFITESDATATIWTTALTWEDITMSSYATTVTENSATYQEKWNAFKSDYSSVLSAAAVAYSLNGSPEYNDTNGQVSLAAAVSTGVKRVTYYDTTDKKTKTVAVGDFDSSRCQSLDTAYVYYTETGGTKIPYAKYKAAVTSDAWFFAYSFEQSDWISASEQSIYDTYNEKQTVLDNYDAFIDKFNIGEETNLTQPKLFYRQCLITNEGDDDECWSTEYGDKTTISLATLYAYKGLYKTVNTTGRSTITEKEAQRVLKQIQSETGPYYTEVLRNVVILMCLSALAQGDDGPFVLATSTSSDIRVMPYDTESMVPADKINYACSDPRVDLYKSHIVGGLISDFSITFGFSIFIKPQTALIKLGGKITEISIFMQELCNFDILDGYGLSPVNMWDSIYAAILMGGITLYFIIITVYSIFKMGSQAGKRVVIAFLLLVLELGIVTCIAINPNYFWNRLKTIDTTLINLGESTSLIYNTESLDYLFDGVEDQEVTYYMPYLDMWSKYNTGYGMLDDEQVIVIDEEEIPETKEIKVPKLHGNDIGHYSVMLADSFSYYGDSDSVLYSIVENGNTYNGPYINNNAYRVVDHFLAPRAKVTYIDDETLSLSVSENENYNGEFQSGFIDLIVKLFNCLLSCFLSLIKLMTFIWQWFMFYTLVFKILLSKFESKEKSGKEIAIEVFAPTLAMIMIGAYSGIVLYIGMSVEGIIGICVELMLFSLTFIILKWWKKLRYGSLFPGSLNWVIMVIDAITAKMNGRRSQHRINRENKVITDRLIELSKQNGVDLKPEDANNITKLAELFFNRPNGDRHYTTTREDINEMYDLIYQRFANAADSNGGKSLDHIDPSGFATICYIQEKERREGKTNQTNCSNKLCAYNKKGKCRLNKDPDTCDKNNE